jgi:hypothetical protein
MEPVRLTDFDWSVHLVASSSSAHAVNAPLLRLQLFLAGASALPDLPRSELTRGVLQEAATQQ